MSDFSQANSRAGAYFNDGEVTSWFQVRKDGKLSKEELALIKRTSARFFKELAALPKRTVAR